MVGYPVVLAPLLARSPAKIILSHPFGRFGSSSFLLKPKTKGFLPRYLTLLRRYCRNHGDARSRHVHVKCRLPRPLVVVPPPFKWDWFERRCMHGQVTLKILRCLRVPQTRWCEKPPEVVREAYHIYINAIVSIAVILSATL